MNEFTELFECDSRTTLGFFFQHLKDEATRLPVQPEETLFAASVLAHYAQVSTASSTDEPTPTNLLHVFDRYIMPKTQLLGDAVTMEIAGSQSLLLAGFFRDQMSHRHNVRWYDQHGKSFYARASKYHPSAKRSQLLEQMSSHFHLWTKTCCELSRNLRDKPYIIKPRPI